MQTIRTQSKLAAQNTSSLPVAALFAASFAAGLALTPALLKVGLNLSSAFSALVVVMIVRYVCSELER